MPKVIYLDSSDYSRFSRTGCERTQRLLLRLQRAVEAGDVIVPFSAIHVSECAHLEPQYLDAAVARAQVISRLSKGTCFVFLTALWEREVSYWVRKRMPLPRESVINGNNQWFPYDDMNPQLLRTCMKEEVDRFIDTLLLSNQQRRQLRAKYIRRGRLTPEAVEWISSHSPASLSEVVGFPLVGRAADRDFIIRWAQGKISDRLFFQEMMKAISDVPFVIGWALQRYEKLRTLPLFLRMPGKEISAMISKFRNETSEVVRKMVPSPEFDWRMRMTIEQLSGKAKWRRLLATNVWRSVTAKLKGEVVSTGIDAVLAAPLGSFPSIDCLSALIETYLKRNMFDYSDVARKPLGSDYGDLMHLSLIPYVDHVRADGYAAEIAKGTRLGYDTRILPSLWMIEDIL
jgi:hypothetical protein